MWPKVLLCNDLAIPPPQLDVLESGIKQVELNGVFKHGRCEKISMLKFLPCKMASWLDRQTTHYIDLYVTDMDKKIIILIHRQCGSTPADPAKPHL